MSRFKTRITGPARMTESTVAVTMVTLPVNSRRPTMDSWCDRFVVLPAGPSGGLVLPWVIYDLMIRLEAAGVTLTAEGDDGVKAVVIRCEGQTFFAGADISEFGKPMVMPMLPQVVDIIESCSKPVVAAIHGTALGGGLVVALASHYLIAVPDAKLGVPEKYRDDAKA